MKAVYQADNLLDAHLVKGALENQGIPAYVAGEHLVGGIGQLPTMGILAVMVGDDDVAHASAIVDEIRHDGASSAAIDDDPIDLIPKPA